MGKKIEIRETCKICGEKLSGRNRTYCSKKCRGRANYLKAKENGYHKNWFRKKSGKFEEGKIQCKICGYWYRQLGSHVVQRHEMTAREYRIEFGYDKKTGKSILSKDLHELYGRQALENKTYKNLESGRKYRFKKGDKIGVYERSKETLERLQDLHKKTKLYKKNNKLN